MTKEYVTVVFQPDGKRGDVSRNTTVIEAARKLGVDLSSVCGGKAVCGKCKVIIRCDAGSLSPPTSSEMKLVSEEELKDGVRLACTTHIDGDVTVVVPQQSRSGQQKLQTEGIDVPISNDPCVKRMEITLPMPSFSDLTPDTGRLLRAIGDEHGLAINYNVLKQLPRMIREKEGEVTVTIWSGKEIICVEPGHSADDNYGFAVDIGTTKMAGYLVDMSTGRTLATSSLMNPQIPFGEDVVTRIAYAKGMRELRKLHKLVVDSINTILGEACAKAGISPREVHETTVVGNTAMHHLFLNIDPRFVAIAPYVPAVQGSVDVKPAELGVGTDPNGNVHVLPIIAGYVGADTVAGILATRMHMLSELSFLIDVGTNTEIVIGNKDSLTACSCASGPAFEGAYIKHGMRASTGAIEKVRIDPDKVEYSVISNARPRGICGSAIVDLPAEMLKAGVMDSTGRILTESSDPRIRMRNEMAEFVIAAGSETESGEDIVITQSDIREIQKAKAAIYAGASVLMRRLGVDRMDLKKVYIAGAFGNYIDPMSAKVIGMFPDFPADVIHHVGNVAGTGARMALLSRKAREDSDLIGKMVHYIELSAEPGFEDDFVNAMYFPHTYLDQFPQIIEELKGSRMRIAPRHRALQPES